jgi:hypothetical protein
VEKVILNNQGCVLEASNNIRFCRKVTQNAGNLEISKKEPAQALTNGILPGS